MPFALASEFVISYPPQLLSRMRKPVGGAAPPGSGLQKARELHPLGGGGAREATAQEDVELPVVGALVTVSIRGADTAEPAQPKGDKEEAAKVAAWEARTGHSALQAKLEKDEGVGDKMGAYRQAMR